MKRIFIAILAVAVLSIGGQATNLYLSRNSSYSSQKKAAETEAKSVKSSKSNSSDRASDDKNTPKAITGKVIRINDKDKTFVVMVDGKEATFGARKMKALPKVGATIDLKPNTARFVFDTCEECNSKCPGVCF